MKHQRVRTVAKQVGLWGLLVGLTALLTLLFNLLGTISIAVLAAVTMGAARRWQWRAIPVSCAFLLVGLALTHVSKAGLDLRQRIAMAGLSFGAFWVTYFLSWLVMSLEKAHTPPTAMPLSVSPPSEKEASSHGPNGRVSSSPVGEISKETDRITVDDLQGTWLREASALEGKRLMEIGGGRFVVRVLNPDGSVRVRAEGHIDVER